MNNIEKSKVGILTLKYNGKYIHSKYDPEREAIQFAKGNKEKLNKPISIIYGLGLGYHIEAVHKILENDSSVFVFEWNDELIKHCRNINPQVFEYKNIKIITTENSDFYKVLGLTLKKVDDVIIHKASLETIKEMNSKLYGLLNDFNCTKQLSNIDDTYLTLGEENTEENLSKNYPNINIFLEELKIKNKPFLIISSGPSLDDKLDLLVNVKEKFNIICVGSSLRTIMEKGIRPDAVVIIDSKEIVRKQFSGYEDENIPLCFPPSASRWAVQSYNGPKYMFYNDFIEVVGTVAVSAIDIAIKSEAKEVVLLGQDLAFSGNKSHNSSYKEIYGFEDNEKLGHRILTVEGVKGKILETSQGYLTFKHKIEHLISKNNRVKYINCSNGACIEGTEYVDFKEYIELVLLRKN
ncbi:motility associated factor glycosyltransferase family protein [Clostridium butyricum]|uniref:motility associated factor glycosyltransferase family protein n=1 Tax=Clostridium butyricum TaxID=1492 RepID=UPI00374F84C9